MPGLVDSELASARQRQARDRPPTLLFDRRALDVLRFQLGNERTNVVSHQVQLVDIVLFGGMNGHLRGR